MPALALEGVSAGYGRLPVLRELDLTVDPGQVVALLGANGAGKTTTLLACVGQLALTGGRVTVAGEPVSHRRPSRLAALGVAFVPDDRGLFLQLSVAENLRLVHPRRRSLDEVLDLFPELAPLRRRQAGLLSGGEQQMLALAKAVLSGPRLLLIDEMSHGLAPRVAQRLLGMVRLLAAELGTGVLLVEQSVDLALAVSDRAAVMRHGRIATEAAAAELAGDRARLTDVYLGTATAV